MLISGSLTISVLVMTCVLLVDVFLLGLIQFWQLSLNSITMTNIVIAIGLSVDFSAHIANSYLHSSPEPFVLQSYCFDLTAIRKRKTLLGLVNIGSSVLHGAFSTFLAILVLGLSDSYVFIVFFKMWTGIILFGISNGFILLPILLTLFGPISLREWVIINEARQKQLQSESASEKKDSEQSVKDSENIEPSSDNIE